VVTAVEKERTNNVMKNKEKIKETEETTEAIPSEGQDPQQNDSEPCFDAEALQAELASATAALAEEKDKYLRMAAEYDNYRRRAAKERETVYSDAYADALTQILPVIDNLERAAGFGDAGDAKQLADGVNMILNQFGDVLKKMGIESFGEKGDAFDPNIHNAIMHEEDPEQAESVLGDVFQKGYRRGDKIIRCAMVKVIN